MIMIYPCKTQFDRLTPLTNQKRYRVFIEFHWGIIPAAAYTGEEQATGRLMTGLPWLCFHTILG